MTKVYIFEFSYLKEIKLEQIHEIYFTLLERKLKTMCQVELGDVTANLSVIKRIELNVVYTDIFLMPRKFTFKL